MMDWISVKDRIPEMEDNCVLVHFGNGSIETVHIEDMFGEITAGLDENGGQLYSRWYINHDPEVTHWMPLPEPPKGIKND